MLKLSPLALVIFGVLLSGCSGSDRAQDAANEARHAQRKQAAQATLKAGPKTTTWDTPEGTVIALSIPQATHGANVETKRCIVWRDAVTKTAALHCDKDEIDLSDYPTEKPEPDR